MYSTWVFMADEIQKGSDALYVIYVTEVYKNVFTAKDRGKIYYYIC